MKKIENEKRYPVEVYDQRNEYLEKELIMEFFNNLSLEDLKSIVKFEFVDFRDNEKCLHNIEFGVISSEILESLNVNKEILIRCSKNFGTTPFVSTRSYKNLRGISVDSDGKNTLHFEPTKVSDDVMDSLKKAFLNPDLGTEWREEF